MAAFLRKKFAQESKLNGLAGRQIDSVEPIRIGPPPSQPPLFAKFATGGQVKSDTNAPVSSRLVSSPMPLSNTSRRKVDPGTGASTTRKTSVSVVAHGNRGERELDVNVNGNGNIAQVSRATSGRADPAPGSKSMPNYNPTPVPYQPPQFNADVQPRQDTRQASAPDPPLRAPVAHKPLPALTPANPSPAPSLIPNRRPPDGNAPPPPLADSRIPVSLTRLEKPLPQPSTTPPPIARSMKGKERAVNPFAETNLPDLPQNGLPEETTIPRSMKGKERAIEPFTEAELPDIPQNGPSEEIVIPRSMKGKERAIEPFTEAELPDSPPSGRSENFTQRSTKGKERALDPFADPPDLPQSGRSEYSLPPSNKGKERAIEPFTEAELPDLPQKERTAMIPQQSRKGKERAIEPFMGTDPPEPQNGRSTIIPPRSNKGKERAVEPFSEADLPYLPPNGHMESPIPSVPVNYGSNHLLNSHRVPNFGKSLPSQPEPQSSSSTLNLIPSLLPTDSTRQAQSTPLLSAQNISMEYPYPNPSTRTPHVDRTAGTESTSHAHRKPRPLPTPNVSTADRLPHAVGGFVDRNGGIDHFTPPDILETALDAPTFQDQMITSSSNPSVWDPREVYDATASRSPNAYFPDSSTREQPAVGASVQSTWLTLHADAFQGSGRQNNNPSSSSDLPGQPPMGVSPSSLTTRSLRSPPSTPTKAHSNPGSKAKRPVAPPTGEERNGNLSSQPELQNQPQVHRKTSSMKSTNQYPRNAPTRGKPLIFAAMATVEQPNEPTPLFMSRDNPLFDEFANPPPTHGNPYDTTSNAAETTPGPWLPRISNDPNEGSFSTDSHLSAEDSSQPPHSRHPLLHQSSKPSKQPRSRKLSRSGSIVPTSSDIPSSTVGNNRAPPELHSSNSSHRTLTKSRDPRDTPKSSMRKRGASVDLDHNTVTPASPLLDDDPFARTTGVKMLQPLLKDELSPNGLHFNVKGKPPLDEHRNVEMAPPDMVNRFGTVAEDVVSHGPAPVLPDDYRKARSQRRGEKLERAPPPLIARKEPGPFPLVEFLSQAPLLSSLLVYLTFYEWCILSSVSQHIRTFLQDEVELREEVLERYMATVGYGRWIWSEPEPLPLSLQDLNDYMRGVSTPTHEYARVAGLYLQAICCGPNDPPCDSSLFDSVEHLTASARAYTRVILRLRAQAESEFNARALISPEQAANRTYNAPLLTMKQNNSNPPQAWSNGSSHGSIRAPSPALSLYSHSLHGHPSNMNLNSNPTSRVPSGVVVPSSPSGRGFRSPLFRLRRAPLLRVFVPSPGGDWLSDASVMQCEEELKNAGVLGMLRMGDVVWDVAVGDEGNVGRMVWDGSYLIDLDYTYSRVGDLPKYMPALSFPPSYFHRVIRTGPAASNPVVHMDISPWGDEIALNLQLLQDRVRTETPQGAYHNVVRWVHRSSFTIRPPTSRVQHQYTRARPMSPQRRGEKMTTDAGWYGTVVVEAEGTNEGLADLQERCGPGVFPPRAGGKIGGGGGNSYSKEAESLKVFRILRERSRPGEIWIKAVREKERLL